MRMTRRTGALGVVLVTIATAMGLVATPGLAYTPDPGPLAAVDFVGAWTNDDGRKDDGDLGDTGFDSTPFYDAWPLLPGPVSSSDPRDPGLDPAREDKDVAICTAAVRTADPDFVDVVVQHGYPGYVCTFVAVVENASTLPVTVSPAVVEADPGLMVGTLSSLPAGLESGEQAAAVFWVEVRQTAPQGGVLHFTISIDLAAPICPTIVSSTGVEYLATAPPGVLTDQLTNNTLTRVFAEQGPLAVANLPLNDLATGAEYPFTGVVCSYYVHADQVGTQTWPAHTTFNGSITFSEPILGVVVRGTTQPPGGLFAGPPYTLNTTNGILGLTGTTYPVDGGAGGLTGLELDPYVATDYLTVSGATVTWSVTMSEVHDRFRVVLEAVEAP